MSPVPRAVTTSVAQAPTQPVILSEPLPVYSEAARAARIQGTVDLRVRFKVDGSVEVLQIVHGLPELNDSALAVARGIKFLPAASDFITLIHVRFELL
jgi:TonB family protein